MTETAAISEAVARPDHVPESLVYDFDMFMDPGYRVDPQTVYILGGPAPFFGKYLESLSDYSVKVVPRWKVANAIGAALARTTCQVSFFADTERRVAEAPEENFSRKIDHGYDADAATRLRMQVEHHPGTGRQRRIGDVGGIH